ncbi:MAG: C10 family peptidase [Bacteroidales bacterium]|nr:C10 family peptidase [Bacteroidales bacterium]
MTNSFFFLITLLILVNTSYSQSIDLLSAEKAAITFLSDRNKDLSELSVQDAYSVKKDDITVFHVVNFKENKFVILSADQRFFPVLAYSFNSVCPEENQAPAFVWWMNNYSNQISSSLKSGNFVENNNNLLWKYLIENKTLDGRFTPTRSIDPLLTSRWNQDKWYNGMCPVDNAGPGGRTLAGCVAAAIGQVMNYYRHPQTGTGFYSYEDANYGVQEVDFSAQTYNWDAMGTEIEFFNDEIAKLLYNIGVSVDMVYGPSGSGMYNHKGAYTMRNFFDYLDETRYYFRDSIDENFDWVDTLIMQLDNGMPIYYAGWSDTIYQSGHAFVCDAYQDTSFFHFNWGWGGAYDGFFNIENLSPGGANLNLNHEMIAYSYPKTNYPHYCDGLKILNTYRGAIDDGSGPLFNYESNSDCSWLIAPGDSVSSISLNFLKFNLHNTDVLYVYEGSDETGNLLGAFTGSDLPASLQIDGNELFLHFLSDSDNQAEGFLVEYVSEIPVFCTMTLQNFYNASDTVNDGSGIYEYYNEAYCRWNIQPTDAENILITFTELNTEDGPDYLRIFDNTNNVLVDTFTGNVLPEPFIVYSSQLRFTWRTNKTQRGGGWTINYESNVSAINENSSEPFIAFYPNPVVDFLNITSSSDVASLQLIISDMQGRMLLRKDLKGGNESIDLSEFSAGIYLLHFNYNTGTVVKKLVVE